MSLITQSDLPVPGFWLVRACFYCPLIGWLLRSLSPLTIRSHSLGNCLSSLLTVQCISTLHFSTLLFIPFMLFKKVEEWRNEELYLHHMSKVIHNVAILEKDAKGSHSHSPACSLVLTPASLRIIHPTNSRLMRQLAFTPTNIRARGATSTSQLNVSELLLSLYENTKIILFLLSQIPTFFPGLKSRVKFVL